MTGLEDVIFGLIRQNAVDMEPGDYVKNDLIYCGKCHTQRECIIDLEGQTLKVCCDCKCRQEAYMAERERLKRQEQMTEIRALRVDGIQDKAVLGYTFKAAEPTKNLTRFRRYVDRWPEMLAHNNGLVFWGSVGTGKTFAAACIANALIDRGIPALVTSFPRILNAGWDKSEIISQMKRFPLMVIDDLGVERQSNYALEIVYEVVDERYKSNKPLIVTTNLTLENLQNPRTIPKIEEKYIVDYKRIYDRILEMCVPVFFSGGSRRERAAEDKMRFAREVFG